MGAKINNNNISKRVLWLGIVLWVLGIIFNLIFRLNTEPNETKLFQSPLFSRLLSFSPLGMLLLTICIIPITEEFAFRFWTRGKLFFRYISFCGMVLFCHLMFSNVFLTAAVFLIFLLLFFCLPRNKLFVILTIILSSFLFGIMHWGNYPTAMMKSIAVIQITGLGVILCYTGLKTKFIYCILLHCLNNAIAILPLVYNTNETIVLEDENHKVVVNEISTFSLVQEDNYITNDSIYVTNSKTGIVKDLFPYNNDIIYQSAYRLKRYRLKAVKQNIGIDRKKLANELILKFSLNTDTSYKNAYVLSFEKDKLIIKSSERYYLTTLQSLVENIRDKYGIPLIMEEEYENVVLQVDFSFLKIKSYKEVKDYLEQRHHISIQEKSEKKVMFVMIYEP